MLNVSLDRLEGIAVLEPQGELTQEDFVAASDKIDPYIEKHGELNGLLISTESFPGWNSFGALISHLRFIKDHHQDICLLYTSPSPRDA